MNKVILCFDLDNTISTTKKNFYKSSKPKKKLLKSLTLFIMKVITLKYLHLDLWGEAMKIYSRQKKRI